MPEKSEKTTTPKCPPPSELPPPVTIWRGHKRHLNTDHPCRIVLYYVWRLEQGDATWHAEPNIAFEAAIVSDRMNQPKYDPLPLSEVPIVFFEDCVRVFGLKNTEN